MVKWDDQSRFRPIFAMEWYVLGNGPFDYSALTPPVSRANPLPEDQVFGANYTTYPNTSRTSDPANRDNDYNYIDTSDESGTRSLFKGELDGKKFAPMLLDYGSIYASMVFRTDDMRQVMFSWIYESAAGEWGKRGQGRISGAPCCLSHAEQFFWLDVSLRFNIGYGG